MRAEIERIVKELKIDRKCLFEVSKLKYVAILQKIEKTFVKNGGSIHWSNMGKGFDSDYPCQTLYIGNHRDWYHKLPSIVPFPEESVYVLFEDTLNYQPKYWVYEMY